VFGVDSQAADFLSANANTRNSNHIKNQLSLLLGRGISTYQKKELFTPKIQNLGISDL